MIVEKFLKKDSEPFVYVLQDISIELHGILVRGVCGRFRDRFTHLGGSCAACLE